MKFCTLNANNCLKTRGNHTQSTYSRDEMAKAEKQRQKYVRNISKSYRRGFNPNMKSKQSSENKTSFFEGLDVTLKERLHELMMESLNQKQGTKFTITSKNGEPLKLKTARQIRNGQLFHKGNEIP